MAYNNNMQNLASQGRRGDTELAHVNPQEAALLRALGGSGTVNPRTGLSEYHWKGLPWSSHNLDHASNTISDIPIVGDIYDFESDIWNETLGNQGVGGWITGNRDPGTLLDDIGDIWNETYGNEGLAGSVGYLFGGNYPGSDADWKTGQAAHSSLIDLLTGTKARHEELGDIRRTGKRNLRDTLSAKFIPNKQQFDYVKGMQDVASKGKGVAPTSPRFAHQVGMKQGLHGIDKAYASDRYNLLSMANRSYQDMMNSMLSSEYKATVPSYQNLITEHAPWLLDKKTDIT